jgi:hypothetical protein
LEGQIVLGIPVVGVALRKTCSEGKNADFAVK